MKLARTHRQKIMVVFNHAPSWAQADTNLLPMHATSALMWLVQRYGAWINAWEVFNEVNLPGYGWPSIGHTTQESATVYAKTLAAASNAIRALDKKAFIISAGLSPQHDPESYARWVIRLTPPDCYDALGLHPYGEQGRFATVQRNAATLVEQEMRAPKPVWFTEYGTDQDSLRMKLIASLAAEKSNAPITIYFAERDIGRFTERYGLRNFDGSKKAAYDLFNAVVH